jgi:hypothetical protein
MSQRELNEAIARATGESLSVVRDHGFSVADPLDVNFDPEARRPLMFDWDSMSAVDWAEM